MRIGTYIDKDKNHHVAIVICDAFKVAYPPVDPDADPETAAPVVKQRVVLPGKVRAFVIDEHGKARTETIELRRIKFDDGSTVTSSAPAPVAAKVDRLDGKDDQAETIAALKAQIAALEAKSTPEATS